MIEEYSSDGIRVLKLPEAVRKRPGMYFGGIDSSAVNVVIYEVVSNAVDQYLAGKATKIIVEIKKDTVRIIDDGEGLPFDREAADNKYSNLAEQYFLYNHDSATADNHAPHIHMLGGGLGLAVVNCAAEWIQVESWNGESSYAQRFGRGEIISPSRIVNSKSKPGTSIELKLDEIIFEGFQPDISLLRKSLFELAHFFPGLVVEFQQERFVTSQGLLDLAIVQHSFSPSSLDQISTKRFFLDETKEQIQLQVAALGYGSDNTKYRSWVNGVETVRGGSHILGLKRAFKNVGWFPSLALIHIIMHEPRYAGPTKDEIKNKNVRDLVESLVTKQLVEFIKNA